MNDSSYALSIDIGGTFTDFSLLDRTTGQIAVHKLLTDAKREYGVDVSLSTDASGL